MDAMPEDTVTPSRAVAASLRTIRESLGLTGTALAARCAVRGAPHMTAFVLGSIERGTRRVISVDDLLTLASVLDVTPADLLDTGTRLSVTDTVTVTPARLRAWLAGKALPRTS